MKNKKAWWYRLFMVIAFDKLDRALFERMEEIIAEAEMRQKKNRKIYASAMKKIAQIQKLKAEHDKKMQSERNKVNFEIQQALAEES